MFVITVSSVCFGENISITHLTLAFHISTQIVIISSVSATLKAVICHFAHFALKRLNLTPVDSLCCLPCCMDTGDCSANMTLHTGRAPGPPHHLTLSTSVKTQTQQSIKFMSSYSSNQRCGWWFGLENRRWVKIGTDVLGKEWGSWWRKTTESAFKELSSATQFSTVSTFLSAPSVTGGP